MAYLNRVFRLTLFCSLALLAVPGFAELKPYRATYELTFNEKVMGHSQFELDIVDGSYELEAMVLPIKEMTTDGTHEILELSKGHFKQDKVIPNKYHYALFKQDNIATIDIDFDWPKQLMTIDTPQDKKQIQLSEDAQDRISYLLQVGLAAMKGYQDVKISISSMDATAETYVRKLGDAILQLPAGRIYATAYQRITAEDEANRTIWFSPRYGHVPVQIDQSWEGGRNSMRLQSLEFITKQ